MERLSDGISGMKHRLVMMLRGAKLQKGCPRRSRRAQSPAHEQKKKGNEAANRMTD
jgi:hypothetical protein